MRWISRSLVAILSILFALSALAVDRVYFYYTDPAGTPMSITNDSGAVVWQADYRPFGEIQQFGLEVLMKLGIAL